MNENVQLPEFATEGSACFDIRAFLQEGGRIRLYNPLNKETLTPVKRQGGKLGVQIYPGQRMMIPTGLIFNIPKGSVLKIYPRSGTALKKGLILVNQTGIIDSDYVEETFILLHNMTDGVQFIENGERIAQGMMEKLSSYELKETKTRPSRKTDRDGGMGSTGTN